ncbi:MAG: UMP kinase, partial [archaeon]|nr:UMP kinase [archaeon]
MSQDIVVISIGGSILIPDQNDSVYIGKLAEMLKKASEKVRVCVVCGGGKIARYYTVTGRELGGTEYQLDMLGIGCTRLNA